MPEEDFQADEENGKDDESSNKPGKKDMDRLFAARRPEMFTKSSRTIQASNGPWKRIRWAAVGKDTMLRILADLRDFNTNLADLLERDERDRFQDEQQFLLRTMLSMASSISEVEGLTTLLRPQVSQDEKHLAAAAACKRLRLVMGADQRNDEVEVRKTQTLMNNMPGFMNLKLKHFTSGVRASSGRVDTGTYKGSPVLVEWRQEDEHKFKQMAGHMKNLSVLLSQVDSSFAALPCIGLLTFDDQHRYGLVYKIPDVFDIPSFEDRSLYDMLLITKKVSLAYRVNIATQIARAVLQLHTAGWVHKSIRSENVLFVTSHGSNAEKFLATQPYLVGYDYARPDAAKSMTEVTETCLSAELYCHPDKRGATLLSYQKRYDLYALACLLTELALWEPLTRTFSRITEKDWEAAIRVAEAEEKTLELPSLLQTAKSTAFQQEVLHRAGPKYFEAIECCLHAAQDGPADEASLDAEKNVVDILRRCEV